MQFIYTIMAVVLFVAFGGGAQAQTNSFTIIYYVTNYVTVTNVVLMTNATQAPISITAPVVVRAGKTNDAWNHSVSVGLTLARGNTDTTLVSAGYGGVKKTPQNEYAVSAGIGYGEQNSKQTVDSYKASAQWNHLFTRRVYDYLRADGLRDYIADINYRLTLGPGCGYYFVKLTNTTFSVECGLNYETENLGNRFSDFATVRLSDKFEHRINSRARIWQSLEIFPQVDRWDNYTMNFQVGAEASISKQLSLKTTLDDDYNNRPASDRVRNDVRLVAGVAYKF